MWSCYTDIPQHHNCLSGISEWANAPAMQSVEKVTYILHKPEAQALNSIPANFHCAAPQTYLPLDKWMRNTKRVRENADGYGERKKNSPER